MSDADIVKEFLIESYENLNRLDLDLIALEQDPSNRETLGSVFRTIHTIKGTAGFLALNQLEALTHVGENLLAKLRDGQLVLRPEITTALLSMVDAVRRMLSSIEATGKEGERDDRELIARLAQLLEAGPAAENQSAGPPATHLQRKKSRLEPAVIGAPSAQAPTGGSGSSEIEGSEAHDEWEQCTPAAEPASATRMDATEQGNERRPQTHNASESTIRVDVDQLDRVMNRMGELVLLRNEIVQRTNTIKDSELAGTTQRLNLLTTELQEGIMKTRMQPIGNVWSRFPRTVRDLALACGKQVRIEIEGEETELDKTILEAIKDPLTHLVRNAVDHGIESPQARQGSGKHPEGCLSMRAFHEGGQVNIEISDDGSGLDLDKVLKKAVEKKMISAEQASRMSEREITNLIFLPGVSTAEKVSNVSGRGVGMDVVKTNIEKIGGTIDVQSKRGQGTTVRMKIPLTLAIIPALIVSSSGDRYAIPQVSLLELVRLEGEQARKGIEQVHGASVYRLRGRLLPLIDLNRELKVEGHDRSEPAGRAEPRNTNIVVLRANDRKFGLLVDEINDTEEIVVKPLSKQLKSINVYAGATIMGDGSVALILDVLGLAQRARIVDETHDIAVAHLDEGRAAGAGAGAAERRAMLLFQSGTNGRMAIDLSMVARLEEFERGAIEIAGGREAVQYRGQIMPLVRVSEILQGKRPEHQSEGSVQVVVYSGEDHRVGLVIDRILDIVEENCIIESQALRRGILGSAVIQQRITDVLDPAALILMAHEGSLGIPAHS